MRKCVSAPQHSMWTDGSDNVVTNFALNSELEGDQCCVKTGSRGWRGHTCQGIMYGVCQYQVDTSHLMYPLQYAVTPGDRSVTLTWQWDMCDMCIGWRPSHVTLSACLVR